jgi:hypothetical protein
VRECFPETVVGAEMSTATYTARAQRIRFSEGNMDLSHPALPYRRRRRYAANSGAGESFAQRPNSVGRAGCSIREKTRANPDSHHFRTDAGPVPVLQQFSQPSHNRRPPGALNVSIGGLFCFGDEKYVVPPSAFSQTRCNIPQLPDHFLLRICAEHTRAGTLANKSAKRLRR